MRSKLITVATVVASVFLVAHMAAADQVQEQLRLMEQRMADMEDRLQATSDELRSAQATVDEQQGLLSSAGLAKDEKQDEGLRSQVGKFLEMVDISGVTAASFNYRFLGAGDNNLDNVGYFRHPNADTFAIDQVWFTIDKAPTEESRGGMHAELVWGETAEVQGGSYESGLLYTGYASYLAPIGNGVQVDAGKLATVLGAEVLQTNQNFNITQSLVFGLQPVTYVGVSAATDLGDGLGLTFGVVNDVYTDTSVDTSRDKAYFGQISFGGDMFGLNVGAIVGKDNTLTDGGFGTATTCDSGASCNTSVFDVVLSADPSDNLSLWLNFDWARSFGNSTVEGDAYGIAAAGRIALTDAMGYATRVEYVRTDGSYNRSRGAGSSAMGEVFEWTNTVDYALTEDLKVRGEVRWDHNLSNTPIFANGSSTGSSSSREDQLVGLAEMYYEF